MHNDSGFDMSYIKHACNKPCVHSYVYEHRGLILCGIIAYETSI